MDMKQMLRDAMKTPAAEKTRAVVTLDAAVAPASGAGAYAEQDVALKGITALHQWVETDDLDDGEGYADRLMALCIGIADENMDGEIGEDEQTVLDIALSATWDYLVTAGVTESDADALFNEWDEVAAERVRDFLAGVLPDGDDAASAEVDAFVFSDADQAPVLDAAYKKVMAVRHGRKVRIHKRISGHVRLSAKQKVAIRKARMKSHSARAVMRRVKSVRLRRTLGL